MFGKIVRTVLKVIGWLSIVFALLGLAVSWGEGIKKDDIGFILFFLIVGAGILFLVKRAEKKAEAESVFNPSVVKISGEQITDLLNQVAATGAAVKTAGTEVRQMVCDGCGARVTVGPQITECEYCGSHLSQG